MAAEQHMEQFVHLVDLSHDSVLVAWGAFWFRREDVDQGWEIVDDSNLPAVAGRRTCIGTNAESYGEAWVGVFDSSGELVAEATTPDRTWVWVRGLAPDTEYRYRIEVDGEEWGAGERWDSVPSPRGGYDLAPAGGVYDLRFRTWPSPDMDSPVCRFVALGDYGVGIRSDTEPSRRQRRIASVLQLLVEEHDVRFVLSLGDNIYKGEQGQVDDSGDEDDDWYSSFFAPYRDVLSRVPVFPTIGNHDSQDTEGSDDRAQMEDNFHIPERFKDDGERSSVGPGLFYRFDYGRDLEFVCVDTTEHSGNPDYHRFFQVPDHVDWLDRAFTEGERRWRVPFSHHPVYCAGPSHGNDTEMGEALLPLFERSNVRLVLAGHEHNFQISQVDGRTYVVSGAGGKLREDVPEAMEAAGTIGWSAQAHLLLVEIDGAEARLTPVSGLLADGSLHVMTALSPENKVVRPPFVVRSG